MNRAQRDYQTLFTLSKKIRLLDSISYLLEWDQETYMPKSASSIRAEQIELMASLNHKQKTSKGFSNALRQLIDLDTGRVSAKGLSMAQRGALREWRRDYLQAISLPNKFVKQFAKLTSEAMVVWADARKQDTFHTFAPYLEKIVGMCRQKADYLGYPEHPYDALLDCFEPEMTTREITPLLTKVKKGVSDVLAKILASPQVEDSWIHGKFSADKQMEFGHHLLKAMGYDLSKGRLDLSAHPFCVALHPSDSRITTRIHPSALFESISAVLHEGGHSLYEAGLMPEYYGSPLCEAISMGIHESQSRLWETWIGQSKAFWKRFLPDLKKTFPNKIGNITLNQFYKAINKVNPSFIRVQSDEITYSLHVILRFELEKQLIEGSLKPRELPEAWKAKMQSYLGITPPTDREGCLQDIHWSTGSFGYFPTYVLGNLYAAQFFEAFEKAYPNWKAMVAKGELLFFREWLGEHIHQHGRIYLARELVKQISGKKLFADPYLNYLTAKYREIYRFTL